MASEHLRMVIKLQVDESLRSNYTKYQQIKQQQQNQQQPLNNTCIFPKEIKMFPWNDIQQITQYIQLQTHIPAENQRLFFRGKEITAYHREKQSKSSTAASSTCSTPRKHRKKKKLSSPTLSSFQITDGSTIFLQCQIANDEIPIVPYGKMSSSVNIIKHKEIIDKCISGLYDDMKPLLASDGEGGTYFLRDSNNDKIACFKPSDEEAGCINNPRGRCDIQQAMRCGIKPSEGHLREIAAYSIDNNQINQKFNGFHNVPPAMRVEIAYNGFHYNSKSPTTSPQSNNINNINSVEQMTFNNVSTKNNNMTRSQSQHVSSLEKYLPNVVLMTRRREYERAVKQYGYGKIPAKLRGCVSVSKQFTKTIIPQLIAEEIYDIYNYMDKLMAFDDNKLPLNTGKNVIINFHFHEKKSNEELFCIMEKQNSGQREWRMLNQLFTPKMIQDQYNVHRDDLPGQHICIGPEYYGYFGLDKIEETKWDKIKVYDKKNNKQRQVLHITTNEFKRILKQKVENNEYRTIPIVAEDGDLEHVIIIDLTEQVSIGISCRIAWEDATITGIYLDKEEILLRHQLYNPKHKCHCLDQFKSTINELKIGHIYNEQNQIKNLRLQNKELRKEHKNPIIKHIKQILNDANDLISNDMRAVLSAIKQIFNVDAIKNAINNCRKSKQDPKSSTIATDITSNSSSIPISYLTTICGSYATTTRLITLPPPPLNAALRSIPQQQ